jgi:hypothetical protein
VIDEGELRRRFPEIPWDQPVPIVVAGYGGFHACRYCIAIKGLKAHDMIHANANAWRSRQEALDHIDAVHHE